MDELEQVGIVSLKQKSFVGSTVRILEIIGAADRQTAMRCLVERSVEIGQMPENFRVVRDMLRSLGFVMQGAASEGRRVSETLPMLDASGEPALALLHAQYYGSSGVLLAYRWENGAWTQLTDPADDRENTRESARERLVSHVWMRWDDGADRSPFPRRVSAPRARAASRRTLPPPGKYLEPFQPNPQGNFIGDCVIRAVAGVLECSWAEAMALLAEEGEPLVNAREVFSRVLERKGLIHHVAITREGRDLSGKAFCEEMNRMHRRGERVFTYLGAHHVAAVVPVADTAGNKTYKILDSWDSTGQSAGEFWVRPGTEPEETSPVKTFRVGDRVAHPAFGQGVVTETTPEVLTLDFGEHGIRRLGVEWVRSRCSFDP